MNLRHLKIFLVLAEELHFRKAAERLDMSQGPLSHSIQALEEDLGTRLFQRSRRSVELTPAGQALREDGPGILERIDNAREHVRQVATGERGRLVLGLTSTATLLPSLHHATHAYRAERPDVAVSFRELPSSLQLQALLSGEIDAGILGAPSNGSSPEIVLTLLSDEPLQVVMSKTHPLANKVGLTIDDLRDEPFITYPSDSGVAMYEATMILCAKRSFVPKVVQEAREASTIVGLAAAGMGVAIVPSGLQAIHIPNALFKPLHDEDAHMPLYFAHRHGNPSPVIHGFRTQLQAQFPPIKH